jgi:hypothetical protein
MILSERNFEYSYGKRNFEYSYAAWMKLPVNMIIFLSP